MWIIHIKLNRVEKIRHLAGRRVPPINQILALSPDENLTRDIDLLALLIPDRTRCLILVVEDNGDASLVHPRLSLFVNEFCQVACADLREVGNAEDEADRVKDIRLSRTVETGDGIEVWIESGAFRVTSRGGGTEGG